MTTDDTTRDTTSGGEVAVRTRTSICIACWTSGSLSGEFIEPDTSSRNTRLRGG